MSKLQDVSNESKRSLLRIEKRPRIKPESLVLMFMNYTQEPSPALSGGDTVYQNKIMRKSYYLKIEKIPGNRWESTLYSKIFQGKEFTIEEEGTIQTNQGYLHLLELVSASGWYDDYLNL